MSRSNQYESDVDDFDDSMSISSVPSSVATTAHDGESVSTRSMRSPSPTGSVWSVTSSIRAAAYREEHGRHLNNYSDVYRLPADQEELERLGRYIPQSLHRSSSRLYIATDKQHIMLTEVMGGYPPPMAEVMEKEYPEDIKACVDLGCGSGSW
ncbi:hypothetical protein CC2G_000488 [Coprinopsis cinerea AmutBmut pab1-1]|nr:hypothetical protein CC2G_000488 [Coprinopsis cinerea AmutBmut pab1-1]